MYLNSILESKKKRQANQFLRNYRNKNEEFIFLKLTINIQLFDKIDLNDEDKEAIELIDFPGLNSGENNLFEKAILDPIIKFLMDFYLFQSLQLMKMSFQKLLSQQLKKLAKEKFWIFHLIHFFLF